MRHWLWSALLFAGGCNVFSPFDRNDPRNCIADPMLCTSAEQCNLAKEICEPAGSGAKLCSQLDLPSAQNPDGTYTLYLDGDLTKPFSIFCELVSGQPTEYLGLPSQDQLSNFSQFTAGGATVGESVRTQYSRVRLEPLMGLIDISDQRFAVSTGQIVISGGTPISSMPYGVAMDCAGPGSITGIGNVNLVGTPFAIGANAFIALDEMGFNGLNMNGEAVYTMNNQIVDLHGGGICGYTVPLPQPSNRPINNAGTFQLPIVYVGSR